MVCLVVRRCLLSRGLSVESATDWPGRYLLQRLHPFNQVQENHTYTLYFKQIRLMAFWLHHWEFHQYHPFEIGGDPPWTHSRPLLIDAVFGFPSKT